MDPWLQIHGAQVDPLPEDRGCFFDFQCFERFKIVGLPSAGT